MRIWLQTSQERPFTTRLFGEADCVIYILDVTKDPAETKQKIANVNKMINDACDPDIVKILVGNKFDL